ncbi:hypothetical protein FWP36_04895 [Vibrio parahaemolyticus]|nr:hypothetical protein [Vibrio parahaemolyticus]RZP75726.1 hypothetical protein D8T60_16495 [Vibrio vulnificus]EGQ9712374.1 hypothetical protein [Vibrio parahaemolyticus]EGQ9795711.1 hypothetical protein [Vibrio parahaemolyticus]RZQ35175.1 hypothetical protein D8T38_14795 [Vibrio vulnificus]
MKLHPRQCQQCSGASILSILENASDSNSVEQAITSIANGLMFVARRNHEYETRKLAMSFLRIAEASHPTLSSGAPNLKREKTGTSPDFSPHPTHREWSVSSGAVAPSEGTPCASAHAELHRSHTQENLG